MPYYTIWDDHEVVNDFGPLHDTRQYRDANFEADNAAHPKTMLGCEQIVWLKDALSQSQATWKLIVSSISMSVPTGSSESRGRDGWANYE